MTLCESNASIAVQRYDRNDQKCFSGVISEKEAMRQLEAAFGSFSNEVEYKVRLINTNECVIIIFVMI